ncbi:MetQ/NlpA family ABC transporter substrate-binding protein [Propionibacterium freudenreichii]|uniref:MetQ/NlpA family ABC transporter substrate-binding protein n=1 Tax=Propionibacterium freudenreichii TaxID=1744 RepID=UPI0018D58D4B|nr:MetQ/NlpA family ABC transporter substrate-binding protein [Propionibacterium freudenreichii]
MTTIRIGAAPTPHAKILEFVQDNLAADAGINLDIVEYTDETRLNQLVADGDLDANYLQHKPYFDSQVEEFGYELTALEGVHIEPYALYSKKVTDANDLTDGAAIALTNDPVNLSRALDLLESAGLITVADTGDKDPTLLDISENPKNLKFIETDPAQLVRSLDDVDGAVINGNYALDGGLNPDPPLWGWGLGCGNREDAPSDLGQWVLVDNPLDAVEGASSRCNCLTLTPAVSRLSSMRITWCLQAACLP